MTVLAKIGKDARFLALLLEALQRALKVLVVMDYDFRQILLPPFVALLAPARDRTSSYPADYRKTTNGGSNLPELPRWPGHSAAAKHMDVEMIHCLPAVVTCVHHGTVAGLCDAFLNGHFRREGHQTSE